MAKPIQPQPGILDIAPYQGGKAKIAGVEHVVKLSSNESPFGPSPKAVAAAQAALTDLHIYPPGDQADLRAAIGAAEGLDPDRIICGSGSDEILGWIAQAYAGPGDEVVFTQHGFAMYRIMTLAAGATPVVAPERDRTTDIDAILAACTDRTAIVFVADPNNPTGTMVGLEEIARLADGLPDTTLLVLDSAYAEYVEGNDGGAALVTARDNVVMTRTFSKIHGLGGMRVGWAYAPAHVIDVLNRVRMPFNLAKPQLAAAEAAIADTDHAAFTAAETARLRVWLAQALRDAGVACDDPQANFVLPRFADADRAAACDAVLQSRGLIVRQMGGYGLPEALRITVGDGPTCERVAEAIADFMAGRA